MKKYRVNISVEKLKGMCHLYYPGQTVAILNLWYFES